jgi:hypothetical protein
MSKTFGARVFLASLVLLSIAAAAGAQTPGVVGFYEGADVVRLSSSFVPNGLGLEIDPNGLDGSMDLDGLGGHVDPNGGPNGLGMTVDPSLDGRL